jgi:hypothetical protein
VTRDGARCNCRIAPDLWPGQSCAPASEAQQRSPRVVLHGDGIGDGDGDGLSRVGVLTLLLVELSATQREQVSPSPWSGCVGALTLLLVELSATQREQPSPSPMPMPSPS